MKTFHFNSERGRRSPPYGSATEENKREGEERKKRTRENQN